VALRGAPGALGFEITDIVGPSDCRTMAAVIGATSAGSRSVSLASVEGEGVAGDFGDREARSRVAANSPATRRSISPGP
jgi:hypothetical protein